LTLKNKEIGKIELPANIYVENTAQNISDYLMAVKEELAADKARSMKAIELQTLEVKDKKIVKKDYRTTQYGKPNASIKVDPSQAATGSLIDYLNGREGLRIAEDGQGNVIIKPLRGSSSMQGNNAPLVMIDGLPSDANMLRSLSISDVEQADIIRSASALMGARGANGMINILTKINSDYQNKKRTLNDVSDLPSALVKGYSLVKEYYVADYSEAKPEHSLPDHRSVIFWSPSIRTDETGKTSIIFYNSDDTQPIRILAEGWHNEGKLGVNRKDYKVE
jgi:hypothetical protein